MDISVEKIAEFGLRSKGKLSTAFDKLFPKHFSRVETNQYMSGHRGGQLLSGRVGGGGFGPHRRHCVVSLNKTLYPCLSTGSTQEDPAWLKNVNLDVNNRTKQNCQTIPAIHSFNHLTALTLYKDLQPTKL